MNHFVNSAFRICLTKTLAHILFHLPPFMLSTQPLQGASAVLRSVSEAIEKYSSTNLSTKARRKCLLSLLAPLL